MGRSGMPMCWRSRVTSRRMSSRGIGTSFFSERCVRLSLVSVEQMTKMLLSKDHHVIEAVPPDGNRAIRYAHRYEAPNESLAIGAIAITNDIVRRLTPAASFG
jgi:hypothetical protein